MGTRVQGARSRLAGAAVLMVVLLVACAEARPIRTADIDVPKGFKIEAVVKDLAAPTMVAFDDQGRMLIAESGYRGGGDARVSRIEPDGRKTVLVDGAAFGDQIPLTSVAFHEGRVYAAHAGTVSVVEDGRLRNIITGLPGMGDHQANQMVFRDGFLYLSIGTVTNSGVVGPDNAVFGWLTDEKRRQLHEVPCRDIVLTDAVFDSENPLGNDPERERTSPYAPYGTELAPGTRIPGNPKCNGAVLRARPDGSNLEVVAWGLRNPYGLEIGPDGALYVTNHGFDARGSRPIEDAWDCVYRIDQGSWYGWPDFACDVPVTDQRFQVPNKPPTRFIIANHPTETPPRPLAKFRPHEATNGFAFSPGDPWGPRTTAFIALFGDFTPATGTVDRPEGVKVVRLDTTTGAVDDYIVNDTPGQASRHSGGGLEHPSDVTFGPDGHMYIADWGIARVSEKGLVLEENSGVVWRVRPGKADRGFPGGISLLYALIGTLLLGAAFVAVGGIGPARSRRPLEGAAAGAVAGLVMGGFAMFVGAPALDLPWHSPPRVLATLVAGRKPLANILEFSLPAFVLGVAVLLVLTVALGAVFGALVRAQARWRVALAGLLFALTGWALLQYFLLPLVQPLVTEKGFTPEWYALSFGVYGLVLGALMALRGGDGERAVRAPAAAPAAPAAARPAREQTQEERIEEWRRRRGSGR
ncbi:MAG TPA: PQQ-dependent sugar dehydrogenase [Acidimicrobiales bacterium]|nr:PQQ-dependent sugar dehydrogenase [Acidimicrobiales bacterium]